MKATLLCGSPRKNGNTEFLLKRCANHLEKAGIETQLFSFSEFKVKPCKACGSCKKLQDRFCAISDDDFDLLFRAMCEAQIIICGSPVYFGSATPDLMSLLDRAGYVSRARGNLFARKIGGPLVVARRAGQNFTYAQLLYWYMINDMIVPGSSYWNITFGREAGEVANDQEGWPPLTDFQKTWCGWLRSYFKVTIDKKQGN
jgi:multimeric flavodoxin WrbA